MFSAIAGRVALTRTPAPSRYRSGRPLGACRWASRGPPFLPSPKEGRPDRVRDTLAIVGALEALTGSANLLRRPPAKRYLGSGCELLKEADGWGGTDDTAPGRPVDAVV